MGSRSKSILKCNQKPKQGSAVVLVSENKDSRQSQLISAVKDLLSKAAVNYETSDCECGLDFYNRFLGPTADEALLNGMQMIHKLINKYSCCPNEDQLEIEKSGSAESAPKVVSEILESFGLSREMSSKIVQTSYAALKEESPELACKILQTSAPEMVSKILSAIGFEPEQCTACVQTSLCEEKEKCECPKKQFDKCLCDIEKKATKSCVSCKCNRLPDCKKVCKYEPPKQEVVPHRIDWKHMKSKFDDPKQVEICKCCDCSTPVLYRKIKKGEPCICAKPYHAVNKFEYMIGRAREAAPNCAEGDTEGGMDTCCFCETHNVYYI